MGSKRQRENNENEWLGLKPNGPKNRLETSFWNKRRKEHWPCSTCRPFQLTMFLVMSAWTHFVFLESEVVGDLYSAIESVALERLIVAVRTSSD